MKTTGIVSRLMAASSLLIGPFSDTIPSPTVDAASLSGAAQYFDAFVWRLAHLAGSLGLSGDTGAMIGIGVILLVYRLVRRHQALYPMTVARPGLRPRARLPAAAAPAPVVSSTFDTDRGEIALPARSESAPA